MNPFRPSPDVAEIIRSLRDKPDEWEWVRSDLLRHEYCQKKNGYAWVWDDGFSIATGNLFHILDRWRLRRAIKQWRAGKA
jgi:hypothetical protein